jgi:acyl-CoA synthetase (NDP forming)
MSKLFAPSGVAVIGASPKASSMGRSLLKALTLHRFPGNIAAVNPGHADIDGTPCFPSLGDVPFDVDLALLFVPAAGIADAVMAAGECGVGAAVVFSSGFAETGEAGRLAQEQLAQTCRSAGVRLLGPNCQGFVDFRSGLAATFSPAVLGADRNDLSPVAYIGQSGAIGGSFFDLARARGVTPTAWVSTGNEVDLTAVETATDLASSGDFDLLCLYLERVPEGRSWFDLLDTAAATGTRLAVLRSGRSESGRRAAASHTGALVGDDAAFDLSCQHSGVLVVGDVDELVDLAVSVRRSRTILGRGVGVVTTSGGAGGLAADHLEDHGLHVPQLSTATTQRLREVLPAFAGLGNPVDVTAELMMRRPEGLHEVCQILAEDPAIAQVLLVLTNVVGEMALSMADAIKATGDLQITVAYLAAADQIGEALQRLRAGGAVPHSSIGAAVAAMAHALQPQRPAPRSHAAGPRRPPPVATSSTEWGATPLLDWAGVAHPFAALAASPSEAAGLAMRGSSTVVLKVQSPQVLHKSEHGAVRIGVEPHDAGAAAQQMLDRVNAEVPGAQIEGILVQGMAREGSELLVGVRAGQQGYPPTITVGLGGTSVEIYGDVATAFAPVTVEQAHDLLSSLRGAALLSGFRGSSPRDVDAAAAAIAALSQLGSVPDLLVVEVNPLIVHEAGCGATAVDVLLSRTTDPTVEQTHHEGDS